MILAIILSAFFGIITTLDIVLDGKKSLIGASATLWWICIMLTIIKIIKTINEKREEKEINQTIEKKESNYQTKSLLTPAEEEYAQAIQYCLPIGYILQPQICLASVIKKTANTQYANELFRIIDFGIFDENFQIKALIEINDNSHLKSNRRKRDNKVKKICQEAQIPLITFWMHYGIDCQYIEKRIRQAIYRL